MVLSYPEPDQLFNAGDDTAIDKCKGFANDLVSIDRTSVPRGLAA